MDGPPVLAVPPPGCESGASGRGTERPAPRSSASSRVYDCFATLDRHSSRGPRCSVGLGAGRTGAEVRGSCRHRCHRQRCLLRHPRGAWMAWVRAAATAGFMSATTASLAVAFGWALWHLPLFALFHGTPDILMISPATSGTDGRPRHDPGVDRAVPIRPGKSLTSNEGDRSRQETMSAPARMGYRCASRHPRRVRTSTRPSQSDRQGWASEMRLRSRSELAEHH